MDNIFDEMRRLVQTAKDTQRAVDQQSDAMAGLLMGRLDRLTEDRAAALKKELARFNMRTGHWSAK